MSISPEENTPSAPPIVYPWDVGEGVAQVQELLNAHGFRLLVDHSYGWITEAAVKEFQRQQGLRMDGIVGPQTWQALWKNLQGGVRSLRQGKRGSDVAELQGLLQVHGYSDIQRNGWFDDRTQQAVMDFQAKNRLRPTGEVDAVCWRLLRGKSLPAVPQQTRWVFDPRRWW